MKKLAFRRGVAGGLSPSTGCKGHAHFQVNLLKIFVFRCRSVAHLLVCTWRLESHEACPVGRAPLLDCRQPGCPRGSWDPDVFGVARARTQQRAQRPYGHERGHAKKQGVLSTPCQVRVLLPSVGLTAARGNLPRGASSLASMFPTMSTRVLGVTPSRSPWQSSDALDPKGTNDMGCFLLNRSELWLPILRARACEQLASCFLLVNHGAMEATSLVLSNEAQALHNEFTHLSTALFTSMVR